MYIWLQLHLSSYGLKCDFLKGRWWRRYQCRKISQLSRKIETISPKKTWSPICGWHYKSVVYADPVKIHMVAIKQIPRYVKGTVGYGIRYTWGGLVNLVGYSDSSHNIDQDDRRSTTVHILYLGQSTVVTCSQNTKQFHYLRVKHNTLLQVQRVVKQFGFMFYLEK